MAAAPPSAPPAAGQEKDVERSVPTAETSSIEPSDDLEKLGRQRPACFKSGLQEIGFLVSIFGSNLLAEFLISGFNVLLPTLQNQERFSSTAPSAGAWTWPSNVFSLVAGAFLLPVGRLADLYGGRVVYLGGLVWLFFWALVGGFSANYVMLVVIRALQGLGASAFLPAGINLMGSMYRPGPRKNTVFSLYGGARFLYWGWFFWIASIAMAVLSVISWFCVPVDEAPPEREHLTMDWWGCATSVSALILTVYAVTESSKSGWQSPGIIVPFILGLVLLGAFIYVEARVAKDPILPLSIFSTKDIGPLFVALFLAYGSFGIYLFYASFYIEKVLHIDPLLTALWFAPLAGGGLTIALLGGFTLHLLPGTALLALSCAGFIVCNLLLALAPENPNYWAWIFPAMISATIGIDIMYNVSNIFITTNVAKTQQGLAGGCINGLLFVGMSFFLGWADLATASREEFGLRESFKTSLFLGVGLGGVAALIVLVFIRIGKAGSDLTLEERVAQEQGGNEENKQS
ncbi:major facilitator superfamily transporter [Apiospora hydei]|uniref:Major facilitator superfamily transporter n=1 Tax=Apiospora hydei TaxID=1337664 RepID=A0ABR1WD23_9PEZI